MTEVTTDRELKWAERVEHMLRLAENAGTPEEAQTFTDRAQTAMQEHMITEELLAKVRGEQLPDFVTEEEISYTGIFQTALMSVGNTVAKENNLKTLQQSMKHDRPTRTVLYVIGFKSDVDRVHLLNASIQIQLQRALAAWWATQDTSWMGKMQQFKARREFMLGFERGLRGKLAAARRAGEQAAQEAEVERTGGDVESATMSVQLVVQTRQERVDEWYDTRYGESVRKITRRYQSGGYNAHQAGQTAGRQVDTGQPTLGHARAIEGR